MNNAFSQPSSKEDITIPDTPMERSHVNEKLRGLYLPAFLGGSRDLVVQFCRSRFMIFLPDGVSKFNLSSLNSAIALGDG